MAVENIPPTIGRLMKLAPGQGLLIAKVLPQSPAEKAKLQAGDLLVSVNGQPLMAQRQLVDASNALEENPAGEFHMKSTTLGFIRDGELRALELTPAPRPEAWRVTGNMNGFMPGARSNASQAGSPLDHTLPIGAGVEVGPGIVIDLSGNARGSRPNGSVTGTTRSSIEQLVSKGETVILTQETDALGTPRFTVTVGRKTYDVDAAHLNELPPDLQSLVRPLLSPQGITVVRDAPPVTTTQQATLRLEERLREQEKRIEELNRKMDQLLEQLNRKAAEHTPQ